MLLFEFKNTFLITLIYVCRMLGLFMVIPVIVWIANDVPNTSMQAVGLAMGAYGFSQAVFQIPLGWLSDRLGRKPIIVFGLFLLLLGSIIAATASSMTWIIVGRVIQGSGAIAGALSALIADLTPIQHRSKAMAMVGSGIGIAFVLAMSIGPSIYKAFGFSSIFFINGALSLVSLALVTRIPTPIQANLDVKSRVLYVDVWNIITDKLFTRNFIGVFVLHFVLMAVFIAVPLLLETGGFSERTQHGWIYLVVNAIALVVVIPAIIVSERHRRLKFYFCMAIQLILVSFLLMAASPSTMVVLLLSLLIFFCGFTFLEATLPSLVSKLSPVNVCGTVMGLYATSQFLGAGLGGFLGGIAMHNWGYIGLWGLCVIPIIGWLVLAMSMPEPPYISTLTLELYAHHDLTTDLAEELIQITGIKDATILNQLSMAYLKVDKRYIDWDALQQYGSYVSN